MTLTSIRTKLIKTIILLSLYIWLTTECLSYFDLITPLSIKLCWALPLIFLLIVTIKKIHFLSIKHNLINIDKKYVYLALASLFLIFIPLLFIALYYPPNYCDVMTYHLPRVEQWIANKNVDHYPTCDLRRNFHQPLPGYILLHLRLLVGNDYFHNLVQFSSMIGSLITVSLIVRLLGLPYRYQFLSAGLLLALPMGIMQATSSQTDYLAAFFLISFIFFSLSMLLPKPSLKNTFYASSALGLGLLTKMSVAVFAAPFVIWIFIRLTQHFKLKILPNLLLASVIIMCINLPFYVRNFRTTNYWMGDPAISVWMQNKAMNPQLLVSNLIRHSIFHVSLASDRFINYLNRSVETFHHDYLNLNQHEKAITFCNEKFRASFFFDEASVGNFIIFILFILTLVALVIYRKKFWQSYAFGYTISLFLSYTFFCAIFTWQPWGSRIQLPWFVAAIPAITYFFYIVLSSRHVKLWLILIIAPFIMFATPFFLNKNHVHKRIAALLALGLLCFIFWLLNLKKRDVLKNDKIFILTGLLLTFCLPAVFFNTIRPLLLNKAAFLASRQEKYFIPVWSGEEYYRQYVAAADLIIEKNLHNIVTDFYFDYPLWTMLNKKLTGVKIQSFSYPEWYHKTKNFQQPLVPEAIITQSDDVVKQYPSDKIALYKVLGPQTHYGNFKVIIFK